LTNGTKSFNELQQPLGVLEDHLAYHVDDIKRATRKVREIKKRIDQATELLETERDNIEEGVKFGFRQRHDVFKGQEDTDAEQYYKETYG